MEFETLLLTKERRIAVLTLNRPKRMNAVNLKMGEEIGLALEEVHRDDGVGVLVLTGSGEAFCAGADVGGMTGGGGEQAWPAPGGMEATRRRLLSRSQHSSLALQRLEKPTIAMVNGPAVGAGFNMACACDIRVGSPSARFMVGFLQIGLFPGAGATWLHSRILGVPQAAEYLFATNFCEANDAYRIGLLNKLVPVEKLEEETMALAERIAQGPPIALRLSKMQLYKGLEFDLETAMQVAAACETITLTSEDYQEGLAAFRERRQPVYQGR